MVHQYKFVTSTAKYPLLLGGYGSGKTEALVYRILKFLTEIPQCVVAVYAPTSDLFKRIHYVRFEDIFQNSGIAYKLNKTEGILDAWLPNGKCQIIFRSMENPTRVIGYESHHAICDELSTLSREKAMDIWIRVLARNRKKFKTKDGSNGVNSVGVTTTPEGFDITYDLWWVQHRDNPEYELIRAKSSDNYHLPDDYISSLRASYPPQLIDAYLNGQWVNLKGNTVYDGFDRTESNTSLTIDDFPESQMIIIGEDFNVGRSCAVVGMRSTDGDGRLYIVDEFFNLMDTPAMIRAIRARYPDRAITIFPDSSGSSRKSVDSSKSDHRLLRDAGFRINAPRKNPPVRESVISTNVMFLNSEGLRNLFVNTRKCPKLTEALEKQVYDEHSAPLKDGISDDVNDALRYLVNRAYGLNKPSTTIARMKFGV